MAVDLLNRSVISEFAPVAVARGAFLALIEAMPWLRHAVMREGMQPNQSLPRLMQA
jgi:2-octaprenyl-6-methoxyphenol hydroxylase